MVMLNGRAYVASVRAIWKVSGGLRCCWVVTFDIKAFLASLLRIWMVSGGLGIARSYAQL